MDPVQFVAMRKQLGFTQERLSQLLLTSLKAVRSYEQGWRSIPQNIERQMMLLTSIRHTSGRAARSCWDVTECPVQNRARCPAWRLKAGHFCWFINGTICQGEIHDTWEAKIKICRKCEMFLTEMTAVRGGRPKKGS